MVKIYKQPFAHGGDAIAIPDASQPDGKMSSADGWTPDYQLPKTDPNYRPVGRQEMNGVFKEVTEALGQVQVQGSATWSADGAPYPINAQVYHNGKQWLALRANSVAPVEGANWAAIGTAATRDVGTAPGQVMPSEIANIELNAHGTGDRATLIDFHSAGAPLAQDFNARILRNPGADGRFEITNTGSGELRLLSGGDIRTSANIFIGLTGQNHVQHSRNILQTTGQSAAFSMSQKAVTDAINNSALGVGQTWQDVTGSRVANTLYTNTTGRTLAVSVNTVISSGGGAVYIYVDGALVATLHIDTSEPKSNNKTLFSLVPPGSTYRVDVSGKDSVNTWFEMR